MDDKSYNTIMDVISNILDRLLVLEMNPNITNCQYGDHSYSTFPDENSPYGRKYHIFCKKCGDFK